MDISSARPFIDTSTFAIEIAERCQRITGNVGRPVGMAGCFPIYEVDEIPDDLLESKTPPA